MGCVVADDDRGLYWATYDSSESLKHFYYVNNKTKDGNSNGIVELWAWGSVSCATREIDQLDFREREEAAQEQQQ